MSELTLPFAGTGGFPSQAPNNGSAFLITNNTSGNALTGISIGEAPPGLPTFTTAVIGINNTAISPIANAPGAPLVPVRSVGVEGISNSVGTGVESIGVSGQGHIGVQGTSDTGFAGFFKGNVTVTGRLDHGGDLNCAGNIHVQKDILLVNADCAEDFDIAETEGVEPGTVMVLGQDCALTPSRRPYDKRVAGVISGAGALKPGIILDKQESKSNRMPVALLGKIYCKVDAQYSAVEVGDLLTTSPTLGHAMKADDPLKAFGAIIGKALRVMPLGDKGLVPILVALQ
jgi:hypothetical protein